MKTFSLVAVALAAAVTLGLAGCGEGKAPAPSEGEKDKMTQYATCMQKYGINVPKPDEGEPAGGVVTLNTSDPKAMAAQVACARLAPQPHRQGKPSAAEEDRALKLAECLRKEGIKAKDPAPGTTDVTIEEGATYTPEQLVPAYTRCTKEVPKPSNT